MLANLLPGIREIRTPLAVGYIWLMTFWLWIPQHFKDTVPSTGVPGDIARLAHYSGRAGIAVALSFIAYLVGALSAALFDGPSKRTGSLLYYYVGFGTDYYDSERPVTVRFRDFFSVVLPPPNDAVAWTIFTVVDARYLFTGINKLSVAAEREAAVRNRDSAWRRTYLAHLIQQVFAQGNGLLGVQQDLFSAYDRLKAEYEFRSGIAVPLTALIVTLAVRWTPLWLIALLPLLLLLRTGSERLMEAGDVLADAHLRGLLPVVSPPGLGD
jgi:hypothetical protein